MMRNTVRAAVTAALLALTISGCAFPTTKAPDDPDAPNTSEQSMDLDLKSIEESVAAASANVTRVSARMSRSGLGENLHVTVSVATQSVSPEELHAILTAIAPLAPDTAGALRVTARDAADELLDLTEPGRALGVPEVDAGSPAGDVNITVADLKDVFTR